MSNSEAHSDHIIWRKNEANDEPDGSRLMDLAIHRILTLLESMDLLAWSEEVEKTSRILPHTLSHNSTPEDRETETIRLGHSYLYRTEFGQMNVWAIATPQLHGKLVQVARDTEFLPLVGLCLQSLLDHFTRRVLRVERYQATIQMP